MIRWSPYSRPPCPESYNDYSEISHDEKFDDETDDGFDTLSHCGSACSKRSALKPSSQKWTGNGTMSDERSTKSEVSFDSVGILQFAMTVGDNPAATGPPVQLDYSTNQEAETFKIDMFERKRKPRRSMRELRLSTRQRHNILRKERQLSQREINQAVLNAREIRRQRMETHKQTRWEQKWDELTESAQRKLARYCGWCVVC